MNVYIRFLFVLLSINSFAQESHLISNNWNQLNDQFTTQNTEYYIIDIKEIKPSLSFLNREITSINNHTLPEIDLGIDIRKQGLQDESSIMLELPKNRFIQPDYVLSIPKTPKRNFTISGGLYSNISNSNNTGSNGNIKNIAYKDASLYTGIYCPLTGVPLN